MRQTKEHNCPNCGAPIGRDRDSCPYCGTSFDWFPMIHNTIVMEHPEVIKICGVAEIDEWCLRGSSEKEGNRLLQRKALEATTESLYPFAIFRFDRDFQRQTMKCMAEIRVVEPLDNRTRI